MDLPLHWIAGPNPKLPTFTFSSGADEKIPNSSIWCAEYKIGPRAREKNQQLHINLWPLLLILKKMKCCQNGK